MNNKISFLALAFILSFLTGCFDVQTGGCASLDPEYCSGTAAESSNKLGEGKLGEMTLGSP